MNFTYSQRRGRANKLGLLAAILFFSANSHGAELVLPYDSAPPAASPVSDAPVQVSSGVRFREDRIFIKPNDATDPARLAEFHAQNGARVRRAFPELGNIQVLQLPAGARPLELVRVYERSGLVEFAEPDYIVRAHATPNDPYFTNGTLWGLNNTGQSAGMADADIDAPEAWNLTNSAENIIVAVIDSGVRYTHEDLAANMWINSGEIPGNGIDDDHNGYVDDIYGINSITGSGDPRDDGGHGTHVSGILGAVGNNGKGVVGVAWKVKIMGLKFLDQLGEGTLSDGVECINYAIAKGAKVINASWGGPSSSSALNAAIGQARVAGIIFVTATGNDSLNADIYPDYPSAYAQDNIVAVTATTRTDTLAYYANYGPKSVDLAAPGDQVLSTWNTSDSAYVYEDGTSMAAPYVTGTVALMRARFPNDNYRQIIDRLLASTDPIPSLAGKTVSGGRLNIWKALAPGLVADFAASALVGTPPLTVNFTDSSVGTVAQRSWDFGDGSPTSTNASATHLFGRAGNFTVTLTLTGSDASTSSKSRIISVVDSYDMVITPMQWIDPSSVTNLVLSDDGVSSARSLPFTFRFYGQNYQQFYVGANGLIGFVNSGLTARTNQDIPTLNSPNSAIFPYWDDLNPAAGGSITVGFTGVAPDRKAVISWVGVPRRSGAVTPLTFQAVLLEGSNRILLQYREVQSGSSSGAGRRATVGIENETGLVGVKYTFDGIPSALTNNQALLFIPNGQGGMSVSPTADLAFAGPAGGDFSVAAANYTVENDSPANLTWVVLHQQAWLSIQPGSGLLLPGQRTNVTLRISPTASTLQPGSYLDTVSFIDPLNGAGNTIRSVRLVVNGTNGVLTIGPQPELRFSTVARAATTVGSQLYSLINTGDASIDWSVNSSENWIVISPASGTLSAGEGTTLSISLAPAADGLLPGSYSATLNFFNLSNGMGNGTRTVSLLIRPEIAARLSIGRSNAGGNFNLGLQGEPGSAYVFESAPDLQEWASFATNAIPANGLLQISSQTPVVQSALFYRARLSSPAP